MNKIVIIKNTANFNFGVGDRGLLVSQGKSKSVVRIAGNEWKIRNSAFKALGEN